VRSSAAGNLSSAAKAVLFKSNLRHD
jgi:hypothetical protein